mmetsp:Transcript_105134/g.267093  ORF Transcript_105134/g.267093 Transcript_105134/m.267093 type:complete len:398 (+) Transcript_105134:526-1719(+)
MASASSMRRLSIRTAASCFQWNCACSRASNRAPWCKRATSANAERSPQACVSWLGRSQRTRLRSLPALQLRAAEAAAPDGSPRRRTTRPENHRTRLPQPAGHTTSSWCRAGRSPSPHQKGRSTKQSHRPCSPSWHFLRGGAKASNSSLPPMPTSPSRSLPAPAALANTSSMPTLGCRRPAWPRSLPATAPVPVCRGPRRQQAAAQRAPAALVRPCKERQRQRHERLRTGGRCPTASSATSRWTGRRRGHLSPTTTSFRSNQRSATDSAPAPRDAPRFVCSDVLPSMAPSNPGEARSSFAGGERRRWRRWKPARPGGARSRRRDAGPGEGPRRTSASSRRSRRRSTASCRRPAAPLHGVGSTRCRDGRRRSPATKPSGAPRMRHGGLTEAACGAEQRA